MRVRSNLKGHTEQGFRNISAGLIGERGPIPGVTLTFAAPEKQDEWLAIQQRSGKPDLRTNRVTLCRNKVGQA